MKFLSVLAGRIRVSPAHAALVAIGTAMAACGGAVNEPTAQSVQSTSSSVINGAASTDADDAVVLLAHYDQTTGEFGTCTGTMITPTLVLTARHCVAQTDEGAYCSPAGKPISGGKVYKDHNADTLYAFTGARYPKFGSEKVTPAGRGEKIFNTGANTLCNNDIAIVKLAKPIAGVQIKAVRLEALPDVGETIRSVGFGLTEKGRAPANRLQREGIAVLRVGADAKSTGGSSDQEFQVGESICSGDSGGPGISERSGAILGVVSRGGNADSSGTNRAANCVGESTRNIYTMVAPFKEFILATAAETGEEVWIEGEPDPRLTKFGESCTENSECRSGICVPGANGVNFCSKLCEADACGTGLTCRAGAPTQGNICLPPPPVVAATGGGGCAVVPRDAGGSSRASLLLGLAGFCAVVAAAKRHRRR
jgi:hypothetical protein